MAPTEKDLIETFVRNELRAQKYLSGNRKVYCFGQGNQWILFSSLSFECCALSRVKLQWFGTQFYFNIDGEKVTNEDKATCIFISKLDHSGEESNNSVSDFWENRLPFVGNGWKAELCADTFHSSPELDFGFTFNIPLTDTRRIIFRGHDVNYEAERSVTRECVRQLKKIYKERPILEVFKFKESSKKLLQKTGPDLRHSDAFGKELEELQRATDIPNIEKFKEHVRISCSKLEEISRDLDPDGLIVVANDISAAFQDFTHLQKQLAAAKDFSISTNRLISRLRDQIEQVKINSAKGNVMRIYVEEELQDDLTTSCLDVLLSQPHFSKQTQDYKWKASFFLQATFTLKEILHLWKDLKANLTRLGNNILTKFNTICKLIECGGFKHEDYLEHYKGTIERLETWIQLCQNDMRDHCFKESLFCEEKLDIAIKLVKLSDLCSLQTQSVKEKADCLIFNEYAADGAKFFDSQVYLVVTSALIRLWQSEETCSLNFRLLIHFTGQYWRKRRLYGSLKTENGMETCLQLLANHCRKVKEIIKVHGMGECLVRRLNNLISTLEDKETEFKKILDIFVKQPDIMSNSDVQEYLIRTSLIESSLKQVIELTEKLQTHFPDQNRNLITAQQKAIDDLSEAQKEIDKQITKQSELLSDEANDKISAFTKSLREVVQTVSDCKDAIQKFCEEHCKTNLSFEAVILDIKNILECLCSTQKHDKRLLTELYQFIKQLEEIGSSSCFSKDLRELYQNINSLLKKLDSKGTKGMTRGDAEIRRKVQIHLKHAEECIETSKLQSVLEKLDKLIPRVFKDTEAATELFDLLQKFHKSNLVENDPEAPLQQILRKLDGPSPSVPTLVDISGHISQLIKLLDKKHANALQQSWARFIEPMLKSKREDLTAADLTEKLEKAAENFSLKLRRRQWVSTKEHPLNFFYCAGTPIKEDHYYTDNDTHIPCFDMTPR